MDNNSSYIPRSHQHILEKAQRRPVISLISNSNQQIQFLLQSSDLSYANALRRIILVETPVLAIEVVKIFENSSVFHDQYLCHRIGLVPIHSSQVYQYQNPQDCVCIDHCQHCSVDYVLKVQNPSQSLDNIDVTSADLKPKGIVKEQAEKYTQQDIDCLPPFPLGYLQFEKEERILIAKLKPGQKIHLICKAIRGIGKQHAKWQPCSTVSMQQQPNVDLSKMKIMKMSASTQKQFVNSCPRKVFKTTAQSMSSSSQLVQVEDAWKCIQCNECVKKAKQLGDNGLIKIGLVDGNFKFIVESSGQLPASQIVQFALKELDGKLKYIEDQLQSTAFEFR